MYVISPSLKDRQGTEKVEILADPVKMPISEVSMYRDYSILKEVLLIIQFAD